MSKIILDTKNIESLQFKGVSFISENNTLYMWHSAGFHYSVEVKS